MWEIRYFVYGKLTRLSIVNFLHFAHKMWKKIYGGCFLTAYSTVDLSLRWSYPATAILNATIIYQIFNTNSNTTHATPFYHSSSSVLLLFALRRVQVCTDSGCQISYWTLHPLTTRSSPIIITHFDCHIKCTSHRTYSKHNGTSSQEINAPVGLTQ